MNTGRWLMIAGAILVVAGLMVILAERFGLPRLGRLPGDIVYRGKHTTIYLPIATCVVVSIVLTLLFSVFQRFR